MYLSKHESDHFEENLAKIKQIFFSIRSDRDPTSGQYPDLTGFGSTTLVLTALVPNTDPLLENHK
jgi:hypothetical protein